MTSDGLYLGLDLSTQQIKIAVTNENLELQYETAVKFDTDLPEYKTNGGACVHEDKCTVTAPVLMWVRAMDMCLERLKNEIDLSKIKAVAGDAHRHGIVYWREGASEILRNLDPNKTFHQQLKTAFSVNDVAIWMDSSTDSECQMLEDSVGGAERLADLTGARCFHRFSGAKIAKMHRLEPEKYAETERITGVTNFLATLFLGRYAPIDYCDASGMSLMNIRTKKWDEVLLNACAPNLREKLGEPQPPYVKIGVVSQYLVDRYGFHKNCELVNFTGDSMGSAAAFRLKEGEIIMTMGTSDCLFLTLKEPKPNLYSCHIANPIVPDSYLALVCFKNSSLARELVMKETASSWENFNDILQTTPPGNHGNIGFYFHIREVTPTAIGIHRFNAVDDPVEAFDTATEIRAVIEGQFLARRSYVEKCGIQLDSSVRILATGGASANNVILQVASDVFGCCVYTIDIPNSASLGNCYRAKHALLGGADVDFFEVIPELKGLKCAAKPTDGCEGVYSAMLERYRRLEAKVIETS